MKKIIFILFVALNVSSCGWLTCVSDCSDAFDFTLTYSIPEAKDTLQVGDTLTLIHEMPFVMQENDNGVFYDIEGIPYFPIFRFMEFSSENNNLEAMNPTDIEIIETGIGQASLNLISNGLVAYNVFFEALDDSNSLEVKMVINEPGEYFFHFIYEDDELWSINIPNVDTCCLGESVLLDYHFEQQIPTRFETDSIWIDLDGKETNMKEEAPRYAPYTFVVVE